MEGVGVWHSQNFKSVGRTWRDGGGTHSQNRSRNTTHVENKRI